MRGRECSRQHASTGQASQIWSSLSDTFLKGPYLSPFIVFLMVGTKLYTISVVTLCRPMAPLNSLASTDRCTILIANPCKPQYQGPHREGCQKETMTGYGIQTSLDGGTVTVSMQPVLQWPFLPETWNNEAWCNVLLVIIVSHNTELPTVTCHKIYD